MIDIKPYNDWFTGKQAERDLHKKALAKLEQQIESATARTADLESARDVCNAVLLLTQTKVKGLVEDVVTLALSTVFGDDYGFELEYQLKRGQSEAVPWILKGGERYSPREEVGGGVLDITSLAMRLALWSLTTPRPAPLFVLDEPAGNLSRDLGEAFGRMLKEVSDKLGIQILIVTHNSDIIGLADKAYEVRQDDKGISRISEVRQR